ncbi:hypothetical protein [Vibrio parahaemolyticus]|uniref:hypothetical protein n=1 Tax=Vibrio parahaemolyticus TaxID=670 RepID=UPI00255492E8|nr:hypothetical protein [Vibrio parahaemolyticus]ELA6923034.1 hypothetical protein [Vibrio parahaemolyticus]
MGKNQSNERYGKRARFSQMPDYVENSISFIELNAPAKELLRRILQQYRGHNNGDLTAIWNNLKPVLSMKNERTFIKALNELIDNELLVFNGLGSTSRKGGRAPHLYALAWLDVNVIIEGGEKSTNHNRAPPRKHWEQHPAALDLVNKKIL